MHNQAQKFALIAGGLEIEKSCGGTPSWGGRKSLRTMGTDSNITMLHLELKTMPFNNLKETYHQNWC